MAKPVLIAVSDDSEALDLIDRELTRRNEADYEVVCGSSVGGAVAILERLSRQMRQVAVVLGDHRVSGNRGSEVLSRAGSFTQAPSGFCSSRGGPTMMHPAAATLDDTYTQITEAEAMSGQDVFVVGGGNSAGQAAVHLAKFAKRVTLLVRGPSLAESMSDYLIRELDGASNVEIRHRVEVVDGQGETRLEQLTLRDNESGQTGTVPAAAIFVLIGARPRIDWLPGEIERDRWGYVLTGNDLLRNGGLPDRWRRSTTGWENSSEPLLTGDWL
jgi:hypothetical protein